MEQNKIEGEWIRTDKTITISLDKQNERLLRMIESCSTRDRETLVKVIFRIGLIESIKDLEMRVRAAKDIKLK